ncbi:ribosomal protein S18-alanine N-acetyltransferase [Blastopirellula retiformator]|uniref:Ribosomal-protein-alanine N-acetyltransferase n=1 Tax=Blastopirellula retiformator TaxID=2527970 RepID=A0A5C5UYY3_9BACT|nr:ribosomal protein S18-alanine N-acetyltransferase [Blastopirellula retiformator]TWT30685.1 ribosomal-protein-alanine N-acetyltransferase [Blastopirellula retiformator]
MNTHVRWMIRRDMPEVLEIERTSFEFAWTEYDFINRLKERNVIGIVAESQMAPGKRDRVVGFMIYELQRNHLHLLKFAVHPDYRRRGVGHQLVTKLTRKLASRRSHVLTEVRETNLDAQRFFRSKGFRAISVLRDFYDDAEEDAYLMQFRARQTEAVG